MDYRFCSESPMCAPRKVDTLVGMGFTEVQARDALDGCSGNLERAASGISNLARLGNPSVQSSGFQD